MKLTTLDLKKQQFGKTFRGYDPEEVRSFLDLVAMQWEEMQDEVRRADDRVAAAEHKLKHYERVEVALQEALEAAREGARRSEATAEQRAKLIVEEAELKALRVVNDAEQERHHLRQEIVKLSHRQTEVAARMRSFLMSELEILAQFQGDDPVGFIKLMPAGTAGELAPPPPRQVTGSAPAPEEASEEDVAPAAPAPAAAVETPEAEEHEPAPAWVEDELAPDVVDDELPPGTFAEDAEPESASTNGVGAEQAMPPPMPPLAQPTAASERGDEPAPEPASSNEEAPPPRPLHEALADRLRGDPAGVRPSIWQRLTNRDEQPAAPATDAGHGWSLRSLVTGEPEPETPAAVPNDEQEKIRRLLEDLD